MRTRYTISTKLQVQKVTTKYSGYSAVFLGKVKIAIYQRSLVNWNEFMAHSVIRNVPLGTFQDEKLAEKACINEAELVIIQLNTND